MDDIEKETASTSQTYGSDTASLREAARELSEQRADAEPVEEVEADVSPSTDAAGNERVTLRDAAEGLSKWRQERAAEREQFERAVYGDVNEEPAQGGEAPQAEPSAPDPEEERNQNLSKGIADWETAQAKLGVAAHRLLDEFQAAFPDIQTVEDVARVARENPQRYAEFELHRKHAQEISNQLAHVAQQHEAAYQQKFGTWAESEDRLFLDANPELKDPIVRDTTKQKAIELLRGCLNDDALAKAWNSPMLRHHKMQEIILKAARYELAKEAGRKPPPKPIPPVQQRAGARGASEPEADIELKNLNAKLNKTGNIRDAARLRAEQIRGQRKQRGGETWR